MRESLTRRLTHYGPRSWPFLVLLLILLVALGLRLYGINWDQGFGFHPDERDIYMRSGCMYDVLAEKPGYQNCGYLQQYPETTSGVPGPGEFLDAERSPLNPHWFPLGSILLYVLVFLRSIVELFTDISALDMRYVGRPLSALADVGSVFLVFLLGRRMYGRGVGLLAAAFTALAVIHVQNSHFYRPETFSVLFTLASFWAMLRMVERRRLRDSAILGLLVGLALAPKVSILPLVLPLALAYLYRLLDSVEGKWSRVTSVAVQRVLAHAALAGVIAVAVFVVSAPYAVLDFAAFKSGVAGQVDMARNAGSLPFTIQYIDTPAFIYQIQQSSLWGLGLPLGIVAWLSVPFTVVLAVTLPRHRRADILVLAWVVPTFLFLERFEVHFLRYVFPLMPFLILMASRMLLWLVSLFRGLPQRHRDTETFSWFRGRLSALAWLPVALVVLVVAATAFYALAFERVYANNHPAVAASRWINQNVPQGTLIVSDNHWDEYIPDLYRYLVWQFPVYDQPDSPAKMDTLSQRLSQSEYLVFYSNRPYSSVARAPDRFPYSNSYYRQLFQGGLGYQLEQRFTSHPRLLGVTFRDDPFERAGLPSPEPVVPGGSSFLDLNLGYADDNVVGYDHPQVLIFRNRERLPEDTLRLRLTSFPGQWQDRPTVGLLMSADEQATQRSGGTWSDIIKRDSWTNRLPVLAWLLVVEVVYLASLPLAMFLFRPLPDRGVILARILGLLGVSYVSWLVVSLGWTDFSRTSFLIGLLAVASFSSLVLVGRWGEIRNFLSQHWRVLLKGEVLFLLAFLAFVAVRAANPDLWHPWRGGEKPMELAYLNAVVRSTSLPPFDPWYAGGYLNYYYWGYFVIAGLIRVTQILPATAFNLAVPMFFALTFTGAYSLVYNLAEGTRRSGTHFNNPWGRFGGPSTGSPRTVGRPLSVRPEPVEGHFETTSTSSEDGNASVGEQGPSRQWWRPYIWTPTIAGLIAGLFTTVIGNLDGIVQVAQGTWYKVVDGRSLPAFDFWRSSRMIPSAENIDPSPLAFWVPDRIAGFPEVSPHITEFPFFTFLFADLHAHMMVIPFTLLVIGLGLSLAVGMRRCGLRWTVFSALALSLSLGALWVINSWDYPSYLLLTLAFIGLAVYFYPGRPLARVTLLALLGLGVMVLSVVAFLPFHQTYEAFNTGLDPSKWQTPIVRYLAIHGLFLFVVATFLVHETRHTLATVVRGLVPGRWRSAGATGSAEMTKSVPNWLRAGLMLGVVVAVFFAVGGYWTAAFLLVFLMLAGVAAWGIMAANDEGGPFSVAPLLLLGMALAISIGVDIIRLEGDIGRMNTLFKYYLEVWVLFGLASAYMLWYLGSRGFFRVGPGWGRGILSVVLLALIGSSLIYREVWVLFGLALGSMLWFLGTLLFFRVSPAWARGIWSGILLALIGSSLIYTVLGTRARLADRFEPGPSMTLDGVVYMQQAVYSREGEPLELKWDLEAIRWLQDNVTGSPVVLEGHAAQYNWSGRIAVYTGLPTILGWPWHQTQQRWDYQHTVRERAAAVRQIYETSDVPESQALMSQYDVEYIVVGDLERLYYTGAGLDKFERMANRGLIRPVFRNDGVTIYRSRR